MTKKLIELIAFILISLILFVPLSVQAEPASLGILEGEVAPWTGVLLNEEAVAKIISDKETQEEKCSLEIWKTESMMEVECSLVTENLELSLDTQKAEWELILSVKDGELETLREIAAQGNNEIWWLIGGVGIGAVVAGGIAAGAVAVGG